MSPSRISVVTPTLSRPQEVSDLLDNLCRQSVLPAEVIIVDGAPPEILTTQAAVAAKIASLPFTVTYIRHGGGTAIQRNVGIDAASGDFIAFVDDDVRLEPDFLAAMLRAFALDTDQKVGGIVGYRTNRHFKLGEHQRWRWYRRLKLLTIYEPGRYDFQSGYPINANMQAPFNGVRRVDFMTTACAVWRRAVTDTGLRFDPFFRDYGVLEDAHFALRAGHRWELWQCGDAHCMELHSPNGRVDRKRLGFKYVVNYYYVFSDVVRPLTWRHKTRFWLFQAFEFLRIAASAVRRRRRADLQELSGRLAGLRAVLQGTHLPT